MNDPSISSSFDGLSDEDRQAKKEKEAKAYALIKSTVDKWLKNSTGDYVLVGYFMDYDDWEITGNKGRFNTLKEAEEAIEKLHKELGEFAYRFNAKIINIGKQ